MVSAPASILADEYWVPETGRARALAGARDATDAFQKASRALRLTFMLQRTVAEWVRDERLGVRHPAKDAGEDAGAPAVSAWVQPERRGPASSFTEDSATDAAVARPDRERPEFDRPDTLLGAPFRATVERIRADLAAPIDWKTWKVGPPNLDYTGLQPKPPGWSECRPPAARAILGLPPLDEAESTLPP